MDRIGWGRWDGCGGSEGDVAAVDGAVLDSPQGSNHCE